MPPRAKIKSLNWDKYSLTNTWNESRLNGPHRLGHTTWTTSCTSSAKPKGTEEA